MSSHCGDFRFMRVVSVSSGERRKRASTVTSSIRPVFRFRRRWIFKCFSVYAGNVFVRDFFSFPFLALEHGLVIGRVHSMCGRMFL